MVARKKYRPMSAGPMLLIVRERRLGEKVYCELVLCAVMSMLLAFIGVGENALEKIHCIWETCTGGTA